MIPPRHPIRPATAIAAMTILLLSAIAAPRIARAAPATAPAGEGKWFSIRIHGPVTDAMARRFHKFAALARASGAKTVVLDLDARGSDPAAALAITRAIDQTLRGLHVVCYVRNRAVGAGAVVALACDEIVMAPDAKLGDISPAFDGAYSRQADRQKLQAALQAQLAALGKKKGRSRDLIRSMISRDLEVWQIRGIATGEGRYVLAQDWKGRLRVKDGEPAGPSNPTADWEFVRVAVAKGVILLMTAKQAIEYEFATAIVPAPPENPLGGIREHFQLAARPTVFASTEPPKKTPAPKPKRPLEAPASDPSVRTVENGWFQLRQPHTPPKDPKNVFVVPIREEIKDKTFRALQRKILRCRDKGADLMVFDMDTWGGGVGAALDITRLIKTRLEGVHTVCLIRTRGVSAGAMIALACDEIVMTPVGKLGDCAPIVMGGKLEGVEREKTEAVLRTEFEESAKRNGYPVALALSMVSHDLEVWLIRNRLTEELRFVLKEKWKDRVAVPGAEDARRIADDWERLEVVVPAGRLLTVDPEQAREYGFASAIVRAPDDRPYAELLKRYGAAAEPTVLVDTWSEDLVDFLQSPALLGLLLFVGVLCAYVEMHTPGFGVAGGVAIACFALLFGSGYLVGMAQWWEIALFFLGLALIAVEVFVTPGFGVLGISGALCCLIGLAATLVGNAPDELPIPHTDLDFRLLRNGILALGIGFVAAMVAGAMLSKYLPKIPLANKIILAPPIPAGGPPVTRDSAIRRVTVGDIGTVESICRPVGKARFGDDLLDVVCEGEPIESGTKVRVARRDGNRLIVERA